MEFNCKVKVVDMVMGTGKTSAAINFINQSDDEDKFMYITPVLTEVERIKLNCHDKHFKDPQTFKTKLDGLKHLLRRGENIVSTHALFQRFDREIIDMLRNQNYTLILDEVTDVIEQYQISNADLKILQSDYIYVEDKSNLVKWKENKENYKGRFDDVKRLCDFNCLACYGGKIMLWLFPIEVFNAFRNIYILTYKFKAQMQSLYYDFYKLPYEIIGVEGDSVEKYRFTDKPPTNTPKTDYRKLIHIENNEKLNMIGDTKTDLSVTWYNRVSQDGVSLQKLKKNTLNYFNNIRKSPVALNLWTTFKDFKKEISGKGYAKGYLSSNSKATNDYKGKTSVAYLINKFFNPVIKQFFETHDIEVDEDGYALSEMLQFIWRSAIRENKEIWIYIPSIRMRSLLEKWIEENSIKENDNLKEQSK